MSKIDLYHLDKIDPNKKYIKKPKTIKQEIKDLKKRIAKIEKRLDSFHFTN
jgi:hypothetical protein